MTRKSSHPRWLEWIPGVLTWGTFIGLFWLTFAAPVVVETFLIIYAVAWFSRALMMSFRLIVGYVKYRRDVQRDWLVELKSSYPADVVNGLYHVAIVAVAKEDKAIVDETLRAIASSDYPVKSNLIVMIATEERYAQNGREVHEMARRKYGKTFKALLTAEHPKDIVGEVIGKGGNISWAARKVQKWLDDNKISYDRVLCTTLDADNRAHKKYLAALSFSYLEHPDPLYATFQPIPMFFNNIWDVPMPIRAISLGGSFWQIIESTRPYRLRNFSAHAQSFAALVKTDFWSVKTIVEDGHQFWRTYFRFNGRHDVVPINVPIYQDAVLSPKGYWATFREQYLQKLRWAWGCSDIPFVLWHMWRNPNLPFWDKWLQAARLIEGHYSWATTSIVLALFGWLPRLISPGFLNVVSAYTFPPIYGHILTLAMIGLVVTLTVSALLLPPFPKDRPARSILSIVFEWAVTPLILPIVNLYFSSLPAIEAQTRLMFGKYLGFRVTEKHVFRQDLSHHPAAN